MKYSKLNLGQNGLIVRTVERWMTVTLGIYNTPEAYLQALIGLMVCPDTSYAGQILQKTPISQSKVTVDLVVLTPADLGFKQKARYDAICRKALELGLLLCPAEVGPALRLCGPRTGEGYGIAMEPIEVEGAVAPLHLFHVTNYGEDTQDLSTLRGEPHIEWETDKRFVFVFPRE